VSTSSLAPGASPVATPIPQDDSSYWRFYDDVAAAQLAQWLPQRPSRVLDVSSGGHFAGQLTAAGHEVMSLEHPPMLPGEQEPGPGWLLPVVADRRSLDRLEDASVELVLAESSALSLCLATELVVEQLARVLRPGGRMLLVVESLMLGLARLAEQGRWAELADAPAADVVLVPDDRGGITRCFWPEELRALLTDAGLEVEWVRPRSVLSVATVERALLQGGDVALRTLVHTELALAAEREGESTGLYLSASARRP
jgi:hypothetical protein